MNSNDLHFLKKLKDAKSSSIQTELNNYLNEGFKKIISLDKPVMGKMVQDFITKLLIDFAKLWKIDLKRNEKHYDEICDGLESIITKSLYNKLYCSTRKEKEDDYVFDRTVRKYQFITPKHLDIDDGIIDNIYIEVAINKLSMINQVKTPKEKIIVLINFCYILSTMVIDQPKTNRKNIAGADEVFPLVVYAIVKGNIRKLKSNLSFIEHFRHSTRLESTEEYYFKQTNAAVEFIENLNFASLNINEAEFNELIKSSELAEAERNKQTFNAIPKKNNDENYLLYHLNNSKSDGNECQDNSTSITYNNNSNYIELTNLSPHITTDSVLSKTLISGNAGTLSKIDLDKLYKEYFQPDMDDFSIFKMEKMFNDFRIVLKLIENLKENKTVNSK